MLLKFIKTVLDVIKMRIFKYHIYSVQRYQITMTHLGQSDEISFLLVDSE